MGSVPFSLSSFRIMVPVVFASCPLYSSYPLLSIPQGLEDKVLALKSSWGLDSGAKILGCFVY